MADCYFYTPCVQIFINKINTNEGMLSGRLITSKLPNIAFLIKINQTNNSQHYVLCSGLSARTECGGEPQTFSLVFPLALHSNLISFLFKISFSFFFINLSILYKNLCFTQNYSHGWCLKFN